MMLELKSIEVVMVLLVEHVVIVVKTDVKKKRSDKCVRSDEESLV
jgi:hypothetical protein